MIREMYHGDKEQLLQHYLNAHKLLLPEDAQHRWFKLGMRRMVERDVVVFMGPASSNKTYLFAVHALINFFAFYKNSLGIISSTDMKSLELKVWGRVKALFNRCRKRHQWLPGFILDSAKAITTDETDDDNLDAREMNNGIVCFPTGTFVDTPSGKRLIEEIQIGDEVVNAFGVGRVKSTVSSKSRRLVRVRISDGRNFDCTPNHPIMTRRGWIKAIDLTGFDMVLSVHETMQIMREGNSKEVYSQTILQRDLQNIRAGEAMRLLRKSVQTTEADLERKDWPFLQQSLRGSMGIGASASFKQQAKCEVQEMRKADEWDSQQSPVLLQRVSERFKDNAMSPMWEKVCLDSGNIYKAKDEVLFQILQRESDWVGEFKTASEADERGIDGLGYVSRLNPSFSLENRTKNIGWSTALVSVGLGVSAYKTLRRGGRWRSQNAGENSKRQKTNPNPEFSRVESVEILERTGDGRFNNSEGGYTVHNLEIAGHPSYSVSGVIVHNCVACVSGGRFVGMGKFQGAKPPHSPGKFDGILTHYGDEAAVMQPSFLDAYTNWMVNNSGPQKAFKGVMGGNPTDISDPLCTAAEPVDGWDSFVDTRLTQEWQSKWYEAWVVAFDGRDNPNRDEPKNSFPFLISDGFVDLMRKTHGDDSWQFYQQAIGKPSRGMVSNRVISVSFCTEHKAFEDVVWREVPTIKLAALDPAYGTGDRCVWMEGEIGFDVDGKEILRMFPQEILPIHLNSGKDSETQIAEFVFNRADAAGIPAKNIFWDSFGRGTLGAYFAKEFGSDTPIPINAGDKPTTRPVRFDLFVPDPKVSGGKRLKRCDEEYSKFVTEMWFSVREAVHSEQIREMQKAIADEGQLRLYKIVTRARIEVETKDEMKERVKKSPDLFDTAAILVEGARRLGFKIQRLGLEKASKQKEPWYYEEGRRLKELHESKMLVGA